MNTKATITSVIYEVADDNGQTRAMLPDYERLKAKVVEVKKSVLVQSVSSLVSDLLEVVSQLPASGDKSELETISVGIQISAQGGAALVLTAGAEVANSMTLTFRLKKEQARA